MQAKIRTTFILVLVAISFPTTNVTGCGLFDTAYPRSLTVYFLVSGIPYNQPADFNIYCFNSTSRKPEDVAFSFHGRYEKYGNEIIHTKYPRSFASCSMQVFTGGKEYWINDYSDFPFGVCKDYGDDCTLTINLSERAIRTVDFFEAMTPWHRLLDSYWFAWLVTLLLEIPTLILLAHYFLKKSNLIPVFLTGLVASSLTLPFLWFVMQGDLFLKEIIVTLVEAVLYKWVLKITPWQALIISVLANALSFLAGIVIWIILR